MRLMQNLYRTIILILIITSFVFAQTKVYFTSYLMRDDNAYKSRTTYEEWTSNSSMYLGHSMKFDGLSFQPFYNADVAYMANNKDLNNNTHQFGLSTELDKDNYTFRITGSAKLRNFDNEYILYNVNSYTLNGQLEYTPKISTFYALTLMLNSDKYQEYDDLDNFTYRISGKAQKFFNSKISLTGTAGIGVKNYVNQNFYSNYGTSLGPLASARYTEEPVKASVFSVSGSVGKTLFKTFGLSAGLGGQWFIGDPIQVYSDGIYYITENDLSDDPYSYENLYASLQLTKQFDVGFQGKLGFKYQIKDYTGTDALDEEGELLGETRKDLRSEFNLQISKRHHFNWHYPFNLSVFFNYMYRDNPSNDPYFEFQDHIGMLGFSIGI